MNEGVKILQKTLESWFTGFVASLPNMIAAVLVVVIAWFAARIVRKVLDKALSKTSQGVVITRFISTSLGFALLTVGLIVALGILNLDKTVTSLLAGAGIVGLALGFAFQSIATNLLAGIIISVRRPFVIGQIIETGDHMGNVENLNLRATILRTLDGRQVFIPNEKVLENPIINHSATGVRRVELAVGVSYGADLPTVREKTLEALRSIDVRIKEREPEVFFTEFGSSSINLTARFWIRYEGQVDYVAARGEAVMRIKAVYDENGITIPFPIRTLDFGIKGGQTLTESLEPLVPATDR